MNNNDNKNDKLELDELNIKSHLNTSLDLSGISVSEDLINRTLAAIKEQSVSSKDEVTKTSTMEPTKKIIAWNRYIRGFAGVAAAVIIVAIGFNIIQQMPIGMKKSEKAAMPELTSMDNSTDMVAESAPAEENQIFDANVAMEKPDEIQYSIMAEAGALEEESKDLTDGEDSSNLAEADETELADGNGSSEGTSANSVPIQEFSALSRNSDEMITYSFREIFVPTPEQAEYITISDNRNNTSITLTQIEDIKEFYIIMDSHQFTGTGNDSLIDPNYTVEMNSPELGTLYTMLVGRNLTVRYTKGESTIENIYFAIDDAVFKQDLEKFFVEHSE
ncbi:MAG: hypothetical protein K0R34_1549 [Herbinix sp.]|jgi:hypothetical protein|nr:hypothetical protein [Herbinix sp.]